MACSGDGTEEVGQSGAGSSMRLAVTATRGVRRVCGAGEEGVAASVAHVLLRRYSPRCCQRALSVGFDEVEPETGIPSFLTPRRAAAQNDVAVLVLQTPLYCSTPQAVVLPRPGSIDWRSVGRFVI